MPSLIDQRKIILDQARGIAERAKSDGRKLTTAELDKINAKMTEVHDIDAKIKSANESQKLFDQVMSLGPGGQHHSGGEYAGPQYLDLSALGRKNFADRIARDMTGTDDVGRKALLPAGETVVPIPVQPADPIKQGQIPTSLLSVLPVQTITAGSQAKYIRQTARVNAAAAVPPGTAKPVSQYGLSPVDVNLRVYAHLSEPVDRFLIEDSAALATFLGSELSYGLFQAVELDVLVGAGGDAITGMLSTSGIRTVAFADSLLATTRAAVTQAEKAGYASDLIFALSPEDWEAVETSTSSGSGEFTFATAPVDRAAQRLWGVPVITVAGLPADSAALFDRPSVSLYTDRQGVRVDWGSPADQWTKNQVTARCEGRWDLAVYQPAAIAKIGTATVTP